MNDEFKNYDRAKVFFKESAKIHILTNRKIPNTDKNIFFNGFLKEVCDEYIVIDDIKNGREEIFFFEIIEPIKKYLEDKSWHKI